MTTDRPRPGAVAELRLAAAILRHPGHDGNRLAAEHPDFAAALADWLADTADQAERHHTEAARPDRGLDAAALVREHYARPLAAAHAYLRTLHPPTGQPPRRIQRRRTKGSRIPDGAIYVGRPSYWGNPFVVGRDGISDRAQAVERYRAVLREHPEIVADIRLRLAGRDLCCWCPPPDPGEPDVCHGAVLLRVAAGGEP